jgi:hypothetical protein
MTMLRKLSFIAAVAAVLAIPATEASARWGGHGGHGWGGGGGRIGHIGSFSRVGAFGVHRSAFVGRPFVGHRRFFFARHRFGRPFFAAGLYGYGYSCWRWVPTAYGLQRVWVCDPYNYY